MSHLIVEVCMIDDVRSHPNAAALDLCIVKGWQCVTQKGLRKVGDKIVYVPIDTMMPIPLADSLGITKYLGGVTPDKTAGRVRCAKLRGEPSFGVIIEADAEWPVGLDVAERLGMTKYVPAMKLTAGDAEPMHPLMQKYTEIENLRNFPHVFDVDEEVVLTEKVHGSNAKIGMIEGEWMAGSMSVRRKRPDDAKIADNIYWSPYLIDGLRQYVESVGAKQVLVFGEVYGKVQNLTYGKPGGLGFVAFDILIDGRQAARGANAPDGRPTRHEVSQRSVSPQERGWQSNRHHLRRILMHEDRRSANSSRHFFDARNLVPGRFPNYRRQGLPQPCDRRRLHGPHRG